MIFRKPYAFLIRYFKIIHIVLTFLILYSMIEFNKIVSFFSNYMLSQKYDVTIYSNFVSSITLIILLFIFIFGLIMLLLMRKKNRPSLFYILLCFYYILLFILSISANNVIASLGNATLSQKATRAYHDIYLISSLPAYYFLFASIIRGLGFDIKKFNFSKDINEFELSTDDNEEFEFVIGSNAYLYKRKFFRYLREIKYFILEKKFFLLVFSSSIIIFGLIILILNSTIFNKTYSKGDSANILNYSIIYNNSYVTCYDYNGKRINNDYYYIIVDMFIINNGDVSAFKSSEIYLTNGNNKYYLDTIDSGYFIDFGQAYQGGLIKSKSQNNFIFIFKIPWNSLKSSYKLNIYSGKKIQDDGQYEYKYTSFNIKPKSLNDIPQSFQSNLNDELSFGATNYYDSHITINEIKLADSYEYTYNRCDDGECHEYTGVQVVDNLSKNTFLVLKYELDMDEKSKLFNTTNLNNDYYLFEKLFYIKYDLNGKSFIVPCSIKINDNLKNILFLSVNRSVLNSSSISLLFKTRNFNYEIKVK